MSMGYSNRVWKCPFFRWDKREEIHCEEGHAKVFQHQRELAAWAREHCGKETGWEGCPIAQNLLCPKDETNQHDEKGAHTMKKYTKPALMTLSISANDMLCSGCGANLLLKGGCCDA